MISVAIKTETFHQIDDKEVRLNFHLENWAIWMQSDQGVRGYNKKSAGFITGGNSQTFEDMISQSDVWCARRMNTHIENLPPAQNGAILHRYNICRVFRFPRGNYADLLLEARDTLLKALITDGIW